MAEKILENAGLYMDDINRVKLIAPTTAAAIKDSGVESKEFIHKFDEFDKIVTVLVESVERVSAAVDREKLVAIGLRNALKNIGKEQQAEAQQMIALISEKSLELERLRQEHQALKTVENEQRENIQQFLSAS